MVVMIFDRGPSEDLALAVKGVKPIGAESVLPRFAAESQRASVCGNVLAAAAVLAPEIVQGPILWHPVASQRLLSMAPGPGVAIKALSVGLIGVTGERGGGSKVKGYHPS